MVLQLIPDTKRQFNYLAFTYEKNFELVLYTVIRQVYQEIRYNTLPDVRADIQKIFNPVYLNTYKDILYVQEVVTRPKILNRTILSN